MGKYHNKAVSTLVITDYRKYHNKAVSTHVITDYRKHVYHM